MVPPRAPPRLEAARSHPPASLPTLPCCALAHAKRPNRLLRWFPSSSGLTLCFSMFKPLGYWRQQPQKPTYNRVWFAFQTRLETFGSFGFCLEKKKTLPRPRAPPLKIQWSATRLGLSIPQVVWVHLGSPNKTSSSKCMATGWGPSRARVQLRKWQNSMVYARYNKLVFMV